MNRIPSIRKGETLGEDDLKDIPSTDILLGILHCLLEGLPGQIASDRQWDTLGTCREGCHCKRLGELGKQSGNTFDRVPS